MSLDCYEIPPLRRDQVQAGGRLWRCSPMGPSHWPGPRPAPKPTELSPDAVYVWLLWFSPWIPGILASCLPTSFLPNSVILVSCQASPHLKHVVEIPPPLPGRIKHLIHPLYQQEDRNDGLWRGKGSLIAAQSLFLVCWVQTSFPPIKRFVSLSDILQIKLPGVHGDGAWQTFTPANTFTINRRCSYPEIRNYENMCYRYQRGTG